VDDQPEVAITRVPGPRRGRRSAVFRAFRSLVASFLVALLIAAVGIYYAGREFDRPGPLTGVGAVVVERGMNAEDIANRLKEHGVISHAYGFIVAAAYARLHGKSLKAGEYEFPAAASLRQVLTMITEGKALIYRLTIPEGLTTAQIIERINAQDALVEAAPENLPEGVLLPDTYTYTRGTTRTELVERMQLAQRQLLDELWDHRAKELPVKSREEAVILASIVEKETSRPAERARVAAVFLNRLKRSMRLQSDPTIIYGLVGGKGRLDRPISRDDISQKTAYNTYRINGLPPTPIANPGRDAIRAVLNPAETEEIYFVADGTGGHVFSKTLSEHSEKVKEWRKIEEDRRIAEEAAVAAAAATTTAVTEAAATAVAEAAAAAAAGKDGPGKVEALATEKAAAQGKARDASSSAEEPAKAPEDDARKVRDDAAAKASDNDAAGKASDNDAGKAPEPAPGTRLVTIAGHLVPLPKAKPRQD
jgi:UPF0755 protein